MRHASPVHPAIQSAFKITTAGFLFSDCSASITALLAKNHRALLISCFKKATHKPFANYPAFKIRR
jgi:hypothetical protein